MSESIYQKIKSNPDSIVGKKVKYDYGSGETVIFTVASCESKTSSIVLEGVQTNFDIRTIMADNGINYVVYEGNCSLYSD